MRKNRKIIAAVGIVLLILIIIMAAAAHLPDALGHISFFLGRGTHASPVLSRPWGRFFCFCFISKQKSGSPHSFIILPIP